MDDIKIWTDGACSPNPGYGGIGVVLVSGDHRKEISQGFKLSTNNRMELLSVIIGLEALKKDNLNVTIYSDSKYVVDSVLKGWLFTWEKNKFNKRTNSDLWIRFLIAYRKHNVKFVWVKGHASNVENNRCDILATSAALSKDLINDIGYQINS